MKNAFKDALLFMALSLALLLLVLAAASLVFAAEPLSLDQAVATALRSNHGIKAADAQVEAADAGVLRSNSGFLPKVTVSETWSKSDNPLMVLGMKLNREIISSSDFDPAVMNNPDALANYNSRLAVTQPIFNGGKEYLGRKQARLGYEAAVQDRERTRQETVFSVVKAYYGVLLANENRKVALQSLETSEANMKLAEMRYKAGTVLQSDVLRARVQYAEVKEMATRTESGVKLALANLAYVMGAPQDAEYNVEGTLAAKDMQAELDTLLASARASRPDLVSLGKNRENAETGVNQARTDFIPSLNLLGEVDWNSDRFGGDEAKSWMVVAVLQWNLFDGMITTANVRQASAAASRTRALEGQMRSAVELQVRQAYYDLRASQDRIAASATSVQEAEEGLRIVQKRYEAGMTTFVDVLGAESALIRARTNALQALYDNNVAESELKLAAGML